MCICLLLIIREKELSTDLNGYVYKKAHARLMISIDRQRSLLITLLNM